MRRTNSNGITVIGVIVIIMVLIIIASVLIARLGENGFTLNEKIKLAEVANIGDYVNYDPTSGGNATAENTTYTSVTGDSENHGNGYEEQTFSASNYKNAGGKWRILDIDESGTITLISDPIYQNSENVMGTTGLKLQDGIGYLWAEEELNRVTAIYGHGKGADTSKTITYYYGGPNDQDGSITQDTAEAQQGRKTTIDLDSGARALTLEDINKICGKDTKYTENHSEGIYEKNTNNAKYYPTLVNAQDKTTGQSAEQTDIIGNYYYANYGYTLSSANSDSNVASVQNEILNPEITYWLASRYMYMDNSTTYFNVRLINSIGNVSGTHECRCDEGNWGMYNNVAAVRALVTLKSGIQTNDTVYNTSEGWNLSN